MAAVFHVKVDTVIISQGKFTAVEGTPLEYVDKKKVINQIVSRSLLWIPNGFEKSSTTMIFIWRMQNKKNPEGEWYKELIFVDSFVMHGYHRNAKIEEIDSDTVS